jgi:hypothetical protein
MFEFLFGKKTVRKTAKYPKNLLKMAKKYKVKLTVKRGSKNVRKSVKLLKKQIKMRMRKTRRSRFGSAGFFNVDSKYGYSRDADQTQGITNYTNLVVPNAVANSLRPTRQQDGLNLVSTILPESTKLPIFGLGKTFFNQTVPQPMSPLWYANAQPPSGGGGLLQVGSPFSAYKAEAAFGKKRRVAPKSKVVKKPSAKVLKLAKKLKIKVTLKRGGKRVYKSTKALNKQIKKALKKSH